MSRDFGETEHKPDFVTFRDSVTLTPARCAMVYIHAWQEYQDAAEALYTKSPTTVRFIASNLKGFHPAMSRRGTV